MRDLIVFGEDFGGLPSSTQHLVKHLPDMGNIIWVNSIGLRKPRLNRHDCSRALNKLFARSKRQTIKAMSCPSNIHVVNLRTIPAPSSQVSRNLARSLMLSQLEPVMKRYNITSPILWASLPTAADVCGHLNESGVIYYCGDDFSALAGVDHETVANHELELVDKADVVFAASDVIANKFPRCKTMLLAHGVDVELFSRPVQRARDLPNNGNPTAGFYGSLSNWLDYDMIDSVARAMPEWNFVFIGPNELNYNPLPQLENVHYLGPKPHHELASYSQHWQASLLPFKFNQQINACNPLKLREYLAAGSPIIATPFPALSSYSNYINIVSDPQQMCAALSQTANNNQRLPTGIVNNESWQSRSQWVRQIMELI
ncbi:glycosyltransferase family protein [Vibrio taketomensis]|uniref:glycosyltransferase n=1 Tax=Vibrio taketomensis TaxID=2572923 RepID=UPI00138A1806|nr:glycosyltransferase [Vibrio taketomensis]